MSTLTSDVALSVAPQRRTRNLLVQVGASAGLRVVGIAANLALVPASFAFLGAKAPFGVWLALLSMLSWVSLMNFGLSNGLRNRVATALSAGDTTAARRYISSGYAALGAIALVLLGVGVAGAAFVDWPRVLNLAGADGDALTLVMRLALVGVAVTFVFDVGLQVLNAMQKNAVASAAPLAQNLLLLAGLGTAALLGVQGDLVRLAALYAVSVALVYVGGTIWLYRRHPELRPAWAFISRDAIRRVSALGSQFLALQVCSLLIFSAPSVIVLRVLGPDEVMSFNIAYRICTTLSLLFSLLMGPLWSAYTDAYVRGDVAWIRTTLRRLHVMLLPYAVAIGLLYVLLDWIVLLWVGASVSVPEPLKVSLCVYLFVSVWANIYAFFLNGVSRLKEQIVSSGLGALVVVPLGIALCRVPSIGEAGVVIAMTVALLPFAVAGPVATRRLLRSMVPAEGRAS